jgi:CheY-like chemotaxis protein
MHILIVEDNKMIANVLAAILYPIAKTIDLAFSLTEAKQKLHEKGFTVVTLDLDLPDSTPAQTIEQIRELKSGRHHRVIVISGSVSREEVAEAKRQGADGFLDKTDPSFVDKLKQLSLAAQTPGGTLDL